MSKEAMKLALEALEMSHELADTGYTNFKKYALVTDKDIVAKLSTAITALREALAKPDFWEGYVPEPVKPAQQEPVAPKCGAIIEVFGKDWRLEYMSLPVGKHKLYTQQYTYTPPPAQQVVDSDEKAGAYMEARLWEFIDMVAAWPKASPDPRTWDHVMVYAPKPAQRTWVGLTDEEIDKTHETKVWDARRSYARAIEAKLRSKNEDRN